MKKLLTCTSLFLLAASITVSAKADTLGINFTSPGTQFTNGEWSLGYSFTTVNAINVTGLGFFDDGTVLADTHAVGLYNSSGTLLASTTVGPTSTQVGFFEFNSITPLALAAGGTYQVVAETGPDVYAYDTGGFTVDPNIAFDQDEYISSSTLQFATISDGITAADGGAWFGANFEEGSVAATPEPSSLMLLGTGVLSAAGMIRRRLSK
jgi:Domain of unknown function (DUF4082)/PEP-CTERM motif